MYYCITAAPGREPLESPRLLRRPLRGARRHCSQRAPQRSHPLRVHIARLGAPDRESSHNSCRESSRYSSRLLCSVLTSSPEPTFIRTQRCASTLAGASGKSRAHHLLQALANVALVEGASGATHSLVPLFLDESVSGQVIQCCSQSILIE